MAMLSHGLISNNQPVIFLSSAGRLPKGGKRQFGWGILDLVAAFEGLQDKRMVKVFLYFSDVDESAGPLQYVPGSSRSRGVYRRFGLARHKLREFAMEGLIPGLRKASW